MIKKVLYPVYLLIVSASAYGMSLFYAFVTQNRMMKETSFLEFFSIYIFPVLLYAITGAVYAFAAPVARWAGLKKWVVVLINLLLVLLILLVQWMPFFSNVIRYTIIWRSNYTAAAFSIFVGILIIQAVTYKNPSNTPVINEAESREHFE